MSETLIIADGAKPPKKFTSITNEIHLNSFGKNANVRVKFNSFQGQLFRNISERIEDLLYIATFIYAADTAVKRGTIKDVFGDNWARNLKFVIPVREISFWRNDKTISALVDTLKFLSGDSFEFHFTRRSTRGPSQPFLNFPEPPDPLPNSQSIVLFSGGIDSLASTVEAYNQGLNPILVSHRSASQIVNRQENITGLIRQYFPKWVFPHVSMWLNRQGGRGPEHTQRTRSFLYTALASSVAAMLEIDIIRLCDNGIVTINLPKSAQNIGTFLSRSTHPKYLQDAEKLMRLVTGRQKLVIENTLLFKTKRETAELIFDSGFPQLIQETVSCSHTEGRTKLHPHCGVCNQCIDRRFATTTSNLVEHDLPTKYEKDIFTSPLKEGEERTHAENYIRFGRKLESIETPDQFYYEFPELMECLPSDKNLESHAIKIWDLFQRHQQYTNNVIEEKIKEHASDILRGNLPDKSLLQIIGSGQHLIDIRYKYINNLRGKLCDSLPPAFQSEAAKNERHVQDVGEAIFQGIGEDLNRESPQIPFATVSTKPDFSKNFSSENSLFIEFKFPKIRNRLNSVVSEMTSRVTIYRDQKAYVLFIVFDPNRTILNDKKFVNDFEIHEGIWVGISR